ncbi:hypothetical protein JEQ12_012785 [Ovis aries]|uniref:Uncharacterized protein n=1 Tax=Ovis aries TaxID=9940 RepID=A0A835ZNE6_SHEEP|nr:hypothetical protein JEQ12_012785 [Ovis aries]
MASLLGAGSRRLPGNPPRSGFASGAPPVPRRKADSAASNLENGDRFGNSLQNPPSRLGRSIAAKTECGSPTKNKHGNEGEGEGKDWETGTDVRTLPTRRMTPLSFGYVWLVPTTSGSAALEREDQNLQKEV